MKLSEKKGGDFLPHDEGMFAAVCVDVTPLVKRETAFGLKDEFKLVFETNAPARQKEDGREMPQCVWTRGFSPSLNEKSAFRKFVRQWMGRDLNEAELSEFDTEELIGKGATIVIVHESSKSGDATYANIAACTPCKGDAIKASGLFTRKKDREEKIDGGGATYSRAAGSSKAEKTSVDDTKAGEDWASVKVHVGKHNGIALGDLDQEAIEKLATNWKPKAMVDPKSSAADRRLIKALDVAIGMLEGAAEEAF